MLSVILITSLWYLLTFGHCVGCYSDYLPLVSSNFWPLCCLLFWLPPFGIFKLFFHPRCLVVLVLLRVVQLHVITFLGSCSDVRYNSEWKRCSVLIYSPLSWSWSYVCCIYNHLCYQCLSPLTLWARTPLRGGVLDTILYDQVCQWLDPGRWFSPGTSVSTTNESVVRHH